MTSFMHDNQIKFSAKVGFAIVSLSARSFVAIDY